jgi:molybdopterin-guanine dinucleotide biosynthesis protein A
VSKLIGAILAGGRATRLGQPKATAQLGRRPLLEYPLAALRGADLETAIVAKPDTPLPSVDARVWHEPAEPVHPLLGVVTALERSGGSAVVVCACDLPFVTPALVSRLAAAPEPLVVPRAGGRLHPLLARYAPSLLPALRHALERGASMQETVSALGPLTLDERDLRAFGDPDQLLFNVNTPADLERAEAMLNELKDGLRAER